MTLSFDPARDGFSFPNTFAWTDADLPALRQTVGPVPLPLVRAAARRYPSFGLCGGMALAAAERWRSGASTPTSALDPAYLRPLLWRQQRRTLRLAGRAFAAAWARLRLGQRDFSGALDATWQRATAALEAGFPVVLGLAGDAVDPTAMHQVLAFGYGEEEGARTLFVYDPNQPGATERLTLRRRGGGWEAAPYREGGGVGRLRTVLVVWPPEK